MWLARFAVGLALLGWAPAGASPTPSAAARDILLRPYVGRLKTIDVVIAGQAGRMIFDTGAGISSLTPEFAARVGCKPYGVTTAFRMTGERAEFGRCRSLDLKVGSLRVVREMGVFDLGAVLPEGLPHVDGIIGLDIFQGRAITIQGGLSGVRIETPRSLAAATRGRPASRLRLASEAAGAGLTAFAPAASEPGDIWLLIDSGNLAAVRLHPWAYAALSSGAPRAAQGASPAQIALSVEGAPTTTVSPEVNTALIYDGALDAAFIGSHEVTLDLARGRAWWRQVD